jgi:hypothetical protein
VDALRALPDTVKTMGKLLATGGSILEAVTDAVRAGSMEPIQSEIKQAVAPLVETAEQAKQATAMVQVLFNDEETYDLLYDFGERYVKAMHPMDIAEYGLKAASVIITIIASIAAMIYSGGTSGAGSAGKILVSIKRLREASPVVDKIYKALKYMAYRSKLPKLIEKGVSKFKGRRTKNKGKGGVPEVKTPDKIDKNRKKGYSGNDEGPKKTLALSKRHSEISKRISKRIGNSSPVQSSKDLDHLFKQAKAADVELKQLTNDIARSTNGKPAFPPGLKTKARAIEKINTDYRGDASKLLDISRSSISYESADDLYKALEKIDKKAEIVRIKDRFIKPAPGGYRDILINVKQSNGHVTELQLHSKQILDVKGGTGHKLYEKIREINGKAALESRPLSADEFKLRNSLVKKSESLYDDAFNSFLGK